jgi:hypothetical protein
MLAKANSEDGVETTLLGLRGLANRLVVPDGEPMVASA